MEMITETDMPGDIHPDIQSVRLSPEEEAKLHAFAKAIAATTRQRYRFLRRRLEEECLIPEEHQELIRITEEIETINIQRLEFVAELAERRNLPLAKMGPLLNIRPLVAWAGPISPCGYGVR